MRDIYDCTCVHTCDEGDEDREIPEGCSLSGRFHVHPDDGRGYYGPCPLHPEAPGDL